MKDRILVHDRYFSLSISETEIRSRVRELAARLGEQHAQTNPLFLAVLNGSFIFAADLLRELSIPCAISFVKVSSYHGTGSTGIVKELIGIGEEVSGRTVVIIEDIVDSGTTIDAIISKLNAAGAGKVETATLLFKRNAYRMKHPIAYAAFEIENDFVVGYGLDYNGAGRNLKEIYKLAQ